MPSRATTGSVSTLVAGSSPLTGRRAPSARSLSISTTTVSYRSGSSAAITERADAREISCSLERPPARTATRTRALTESSCVVSTKRPTKRVTSVFGFACEPPTGSCEMHDAVAARSRRCPRARHACGSPAFSSVVWAIATSWVVTSGTAEVDGPFETETVTVEPREPSDPPFGSWSVTIPAAWSESTSIRETPKPARWSSDAACSYGSPTTFGTVTGRGPFDTLIRTCVPSTTTVPAPGDCPVTVPSSRSELTSTTWASSPARVSSATASSARLADDARNRHLRLPGGDVDADDLALVDARPLGRVLREDDALLDVRVRHAPNVRE